MTRVRIAQTQAVEYDIDLNSSIYAAFETVEQALAYDVECFENGELYFDGVDFEVYAPWGEILA